MTPPSHLACIQELQAGKRILGDSCGVAAHLLHDAVALNCSSVEPRDEIVLQANLNRLLERSLETEENE